MHEWGQAHPALIRADWGLGLLGGEMAGGWPACPDQGPINTRPAVANWGQLGEGPAPK